MRLSRTGEKEADLIQLSQTVYIDSEIDREAIFV